MAEIELVGIYDVNGFANVHLVELIVNYPPPQVDVGTFCQSDDSLPRSSWQTAYDEHYLDDAGTSIIGNAFENHRLPGTSTRIVFFLHDIDFSKPLLWQNGEIMLSSPVAMPDRLAKLIAYEPVD